MSGLNEETVGAMGLGLILAAASLLAVWAALSRRPWQYRCLVLVGILALLLFANVYEPILLFVIAWSVTIGGLVGMRWILRAIRLRRNSEPIPRPRGAPKFYLSDVLWLLALAPVTIAIVTHATRMSLNFPWSHLLVATGVLFVMTLTASCATLLVHRTPWRICWAVLFGAAVIVVLDVRRVLARCPRFIVKSPPMPNIRMTDSGNHGESQKIRRWRRITGSATVACLSPFRASWAFWTCPACVRAAL